MIFRRFLAYLLFGGMVLLASACSGEDEVTKVPMSTASVTSESQIHMPLSDYLTNENDEATIQRAVGREQVRCAARYGVTAQPFRVDMDSIRISSGTSRRFGLVSLEEAKQYGYGYPKTSGEDDRKDPTAEDLLADEAISGSDAKGNPSKLRDSQGNGLPEGGCGAEGWREIRGEVAPGFDDLPRQLLEEARTLTEADANFQAVEADWSACMAKRGHEFKHRYEAGDSASGKGAEYERQMAVMDMECALETNYVGRAVAIDSGYQKALIDKNEAQLRQALTDKKTLMDNAKKALK